MEKPRVALVYDRVNSWGGAERVLLELHTLFPDAPLFTSVYESARTPWSKGWDIRPSFLQRIPFLRSRHQLVGWLMPLVFEQHDLSEYDVIISVTSEFAKSVITKPDQLHICYVLTPTRYLWSHSQEYLAQLPELLQPFARGVIDLLRAYDRVSASRPDVMVAISKLVQERVERWYNRECKQVIYPPLQELIPSQNPQVSLPEEYVLSWGRFVGYKRFQDVLQGAHELDIPAVIIGEGPWLARLEALARQLDPSGDRLKVFSGFSEAELHWCLDHARAAIFPQVEDFGISILEARLAGLPVVVQQDSGAHELISGQRGVYLLDDENRENLKQALKKAWAFSGDRLDIRDRARQYAGERFVQEWRTFLEDEYREFRRQSSVTNTRKEL